ncbi:uncharacterized protein LOC127497432 [Ctenopharyngodon idella]|uniref:uncharacterized protein LOC127497432 n=1 Tax=Ctenopharyngodon idella TaxID=7959 RepID=UPI002230B7E9|nr:uncharacterized protein LOC127497432 [Ctenopharyngodon idella]
MALFSSVFRRLFERFAHFLRRRETQPCAAQELAAVEKLPEECEAFDFTANDRKCRKRRRKVPKKCQLGEREEEREVKIKGKINHKDEPEEEREPLRLEKIKKSGRVHLKKREMHSLEKLMEGGSELREAGVKKRKKRKLKQRKATEPTPLLVEVKPLHTPVRSSFLNPIEGELPMLPSVSEHLSLPAARFKPLPPVTKPPVSPQKPHVDPPKLLAVPPCPDEVVSFQCSSSQVHPSKPQVLPLAVPPRPTPAPDDLFSSSQGRHPKRLPPSPTPAPDEVVALQRPPSRKPQPFTSSLFELPPELMLVDIEDEENEYVEYTGKTFRASDVLRSERPQMPEAEMKPRKMVAWLDKDSEMPEEAWESEVVEVQEFEEEDPSEMGDSSAIQGHASQKTDELTMKLFCVTSPDGPKNETQHTVNVQEKCKRKVTLFLFTWAEEKAKKKGEKKIIKEKERREKELLLERYMNDPKLKHLWINKHNRNYCFS